jgi:acyl-coenzyme A synthetase/AMP-(fatty) acid ligase
MTSTIIRSPYPEVTIPDLPLPAFVFADAAKHAAKPALIDGPSGRAITYRELVGGARLVAGGLAARGLRQGDVFAIYCPNLPEYAVAFYGALLAGGVNTTINPLYTVDELATQLNDAAASYLLTRWTVEAGRPSRAAMRAGPSRSRRRSRRMRCSSRAAVRRGLLMGVLGRSTRPAGPTCW